MKDKVSDIILKIKNKMDNRKPDFDATNETNRIIKESENKKASLLLEMGMITYSKIRDNEIIDESFDEITQAILELDKIIYAKKVHLQEIEQMKYKTVCECGYKIDTSSNFCAECGKKIEININEEKTIVCNSCNYKTEEDSNYCECCGNKMKV